MRGRNSLEIASCMRQHYASVCACACGKPVGSNIHAQPSRNISFNYFLFFFQKYGGSDTGLIPVCPSLTLELQLFIKEGGFCIVLDQPIPLDRLVLKNIDPFHVTGTLMCVLYIHVLYTQKTKSLICGLNIGLKVFLYIWITGLKHVSSHIEGDLKTSKLYFFVYHTLFWPGGLAIGGTLF